MFRFFLILLLCTLFAACSSDDSVPLREWFKDQGIATSYGKEYQEIEVSLLRNYNLRDSSAFMVSSFAALGNVNNVEQMLYFGLVVAGELDPVWKLNADSIFYANFYDGNIPEEQKKIEARFYWLKEDSTEHDTTWLKLQKKFKDSANISIDWKAGETRDTFNISLPEEFLKLKADTLRLLTGIRLLTKDVVLRIAELSILDVPGLLRVAQKANVEREDFRLRAGIRDSFNIVINVDDKDKIKAGKTVVFAQLVLPKSSDTTGSELGHPVPVLVFNEEYRVDTAFVEAHGHPNLVFWQGDTLKLQVTRSLRSYVNAANLPDTLSFTLMLGNPILNPKSPSFFSSANFSSRPAYASYDFSTAFEGKAKLRLWYAETDNH